METKRCSKCEEVKPLSEFHRRTASVDGHNPQCKQCRKEYTRQYCAEHQEEIKERNHQRYAEHRQERREKARKHRAEHREEINEYHRQWRAKNSERINEYERQRQQKNNHKSGRRWRAENPNYHQQYRIDNAGKYRAYTANRKALSLAAEGTFTDEQFVELCDKYDNRCLCCGKSNVKLVADHIVPLSKGGSNDISNIQPTCGPCNSKKHTKTIDYRPDSDKQTSEQKDNIEISQPILVPKSDPKKTPKG